MTAMHIDCYYHLLFIVIIAAIIIIIVGIVWFVYIDCYYIYDCCYMYIIYMIVIKIIKQNNKQ